MTRASHLSLCTAAATEAIDLPVVVVRDMPPRWTLYLAVRTVTAGVDLARTGHCRYGVRGVADYFVLLYITAGTYWNGDVPAAIQIAGQAVCDGSAHLTTQHELRGAVRSRTHLGLSQQSQLEASLSLWMMK